MAAIRRNHFWGSLEPRSIVTWAATTFAFWTLIALSFGAFGYVASMRSGDGQPWWPSFGYSLTVFSVWAGMTWPIVWSTAEVEGRVANQTMRIVIYAAGLPIVCALHVFAFAGLYWPLYNDGGRIPTRWDMGERMLLANLDTNATFYIGLVAGTAILTRRRRVAETVAERHAKAETSGEDSLVIRSRGGFVRVLLAAIDRIEAAGDYSQVHAGGAVHLMDESLSSLEARLPSDRFLRIHRSTIIALNRVAKVQGVGRGDAIVTLTNDAQVRLSRRYRNEFENWMSAR